MRLYEILDSEDFHSAFKEHNWIFTTEKNLITPKPLADLEEYIRINCSEALKDIRHTGKSLYRGTRDTSYLIKLEKTRENRQPVDTAIENQNHADDLLIKLGYSVLRHNSTFCSSDSTMAERYGMVYYFYPLNGFKFMWSVNHSDGMDWVNNIMPNKRNLTKCLYRVRDKLIETTKNLLKFQYSKEIMNLAETETYVQNKSRYSFNSPSLTTLDIYHRIIGTLSYMVVENPKTQTLETDDTLVEIVKEKIPSLYKIFMDYKSKYTKFCNTTSLEDCDPDLVNLMHIPDKLLLLYFNTGDKKYAETYLKDTAALLTRDFDDAIESGNEIMIVGSYLMIAIDTPGWGNVARKLRIGA